MTKILYIIYLSFPQCLEYLLLYEQCVLRLVLDGVTHIARKAEDILSIVENLNK